MVIDFIHQDDKTWFLIWYHIFCNVYSYFCRQQCTVGSIVTFCLIFNRVTTSPVIRKSDEFSNALHIINAPPQGLLVVNSYLITLLWSAVGINNYYIAIMLLVYGLYWYNGIIRWLFEMDFDCYYQLSSIKYF